jgi:hypothetical protein
MEVRNCYLFDNPPMLKYKFGAGAVSFCSSDSGSIKLCGYGSATLPFKMATGL